VTSLTNHFTEDGAEICDGFQNKITKDRKVPLY
jgi:hypothetical protein